MKWRFRKPYLREREWRKKFAILPTKMQDGSIVWLSCYYRQYAYISGGTQKLSWHKLTIKSSYRYKLPI